MAARRTRTPLPGPLRAVALSLAAAISVALTAAAVSYLLFPINGIVVEGARMLPENAVWEAIPDRASLPTLNGDRVEEKLEANPWVKGAEVTEDWASGIVTVQVQERRAVLRGEISGRTRYFAADGGELPGAGGARLEPIALERGRLEEILAVTRVLDENGVGLEAVNGVGAGGVEAVVSGRRVLLGSEVEAGQARALEGVAERHPEASYLDLRSPERIVVGESAAPGGQEEG